VAAATLYALALLVLSRTKTLTMLWLCSANEAKRLTPIGQRLDLL